jgi:hypothetical protein
MSNTPETDKNLWNHGDEIDPSMRPDSHGNWVPEDFARKLERERDEAREIAQQLINIASHCLGWHENANPETITEAIKRWNASTKK